VETPTDQPAPADGETTLPVPRGSARPRDEQSGAAGSSPPRPPSDTRRKRPSEGRYAGWRDGLEREFCAHAERLLPTTFPVASHTGVATIAMAVVARRSSALLLCTYSHCGAHAWPDGEIVEVAVSTNPALDELCEGDSRHNSE